MMAKMGSVEEWLTTDELDDRASSHPRDPSEWTYLSRLRVLHLQEIPTFRDPKILFRRR